MLPVELTGAIRAPLEERIRELETEWDARYVLVVPVEEYTVAIKAPLEAENERLREALRPLVAAYDGGDLECPHFHSCPAHRDRVRNVGPCNCGAGEIESAIENARALTTHPSSTEDTKLCPVCGVQNDHTVIGHEDYPDHVWAGAKEGGE